MAALTAVGANEVTRVANTGVVARVHGKNRGAPVVAVRGDIDALPIQEATGLPYASTVPGVMHACGHDVHATWAVGAAALLAARPAEGDVLVVLQPAEETGKGALAILETGVLDGVKAIFGGHVDRRFAVGRSGGRRSARVADMFGSRFLAPRQRRGYTSREIRSWQRRRSFRLSVDRIAPIESGDSRSRNGR
jgi:amidohydrolase